MEEYLKIERAAEVRSEYIEGEMVAMAGGTRNHALVALAAASRLERQLQSRSCEVAGSDLRLLCRHGTLFTYPDVVVYCESAKFLDEDEDTLTDATAIVEVLSRSTRNYDRGEKFVAYRTLPSFSEYLLLDRYAVHAEHYARQPDGAWLFRELSGPEATVVLRSIGCTLELGSVYSKVKIKGDQRTI